jgi:energy-coupling factor transport system ATP-binding protein
VDVIKGLSLKVPFGKLSCIVGGNGTGKTTALSLIGGSLKPYRGTIQIKGQKMTKHVDKEKYNTQIVMLPQNPQTLFLEKTVRLDLYEMLEKTPLSETEKAVRVYDMALKLEISELLDCHPYDLSGGEQQRVAMAKVLLLEPDILLLDEPTKGLDSHYKKKLASIFKKLLAEGKTILMVSHDIEFCGKYGDLCAMFFDGGVLTTNTPNHFFSGNSFYTTAANRMSRHIFENAVTTQDVIDICQRNLELALE